jgi:hypothetical protein
MRRRISYANVAATLALVFSMSGGALAASHYLISSTKQISPKVLKALKGKNGTPGAPGKEGGTGKEGTPGKEGVKGAIGGEGKEGPRGPGIVATGSSKGSTTCSLTGGGEEKFCFDTTLAFTPATNATCQVTVNTQIGTFTVGKPTTQGPYFRIAIKEGSTEVNDKVYGYYFFGTAGEKSIYQERTKLIPVTAGTTYNFGAFYGGIEGEWATVSSRFEVVYICYGS